jgi:hypothetical protein
MHLQQALSKKASHVIAASAVLLLLGSGVAYATEHKVFSFSHEFQVVDPEQPVVDISVTGNFINHDIAIQVNLSSYEGVKQLNGTYSVILQIWNDTSNSYEPFQTLASNQTITLTPQPTTLNYTFTTDTAGNYNVDVEFVTTSVVLE